MKILHKIAICMGAGFLTLSATSCTDWLDREDDGQLQESEVFSRYDKVSNLVTQLYSDMYTRSQGFNELGSHNIGTLCDELEYNKADLDAPYKILSGQMSADPKFIGESSGIQVGDWDSPNWWWKDYFTLRKVNKIIAGVEQYQTPDHPTKTGLLKQRLGETYFFRAYYHYLILRWHGEMVYADRVYEPGEDNSKYAVREDVHTSVEKMVKDLDKAASMLPVLQTGEEFNRIDKGTCLALKAIVLWIDAQPLYNGGLRDADGNPTGVSPLGDNDTRVGAKEYLKYDPERWKKAAEAAKAVINLNNNGAKRYSLYKGYTSSDFIANTDNKVYTRLEKMFTEDAFYNKEAILTLTNGKDTRWIGDNVPASYADGNGQTRNQPTQEQVDEYEYVDPNKNCGYGIFSEQAKEAGYDDQDPYVNRDPRFYRDIVYLGAKFLNKGVPYNTAEGTDKYENSTVRYTRNTRTGYALRKFMQNEWSTNSSVVGMKFPLIRLPEIMLIYAEALNESDGDVATIKKMLNDIRERSFMAPVPDDLFESNKKVRREYIDRERRVELFFENNRFYTLRYEGLINNPIELQKEKNYLALDGDGNLRAQKWVEQGNGEYPQTQHYIHGMMPVEDANGKIAIGSKMYIMKRFEGKQLTPRIVTWRNYFFPITSNEIAKTPTLLQNPGW